MASRNKRINDKWNFRARNFLAQWSVTWGNDGNEEFILPTPLGKMQKVERRAAQGEIVRDKKQIPP